MLVISHLDYLKKTTATARVAIRFLEHETHSGNRFLRLQRPEEQPEKLTQLSRWASGRKVAKSESPDGAPPVTGPPDDDDPVANPRVVKRWLSILDCAVYFSQTKISMLLTEDAKRPETDSTDQSVVSQAPSRDCSPAALPLNIQSSLCCDLLHLNRISSDTNVPCADKTSLVSILVGSREAAPSDTIVPQEFVGLVNKYDIHLELLRDFMSRWRRSRQSHTKAKSKERNVT
ncbi:unnamed protein product [Dicrocoelium dendriticum]|nr:unnamed protein product [Dicrocoelium dendriticum]